MWTEILKAALTLGILGLVMGVLLAVASRIFAVHTDERVDQIAAILPGANCGGCGFAGCTAYATAVVRGEAPPSACAAGGAETAQGIAKILGVDVSVRERRVAHVFLFRRRRNGAPLSIYGHPNLLRRLAHGKRSCRNVRLPASVLATA